jgi:hypothetical protein
LIFPPLVLTDDQVHETYHFKAGKLLKGLNISLTLFVFLLVVICCITKVEVAIHPLVELGSFFIVSCLKKLSSNTFKVVNSGKFVCYSELVKIYVLRD